jgi:hypothetical protein
MTDCFALVNGKCIALEVTNCNGCKFRKSLREYQDDFDRCTNHLHEIGRLDLVKKYAVAHKAQQSHIWRQDLWKWDDIALALNEQSSASSQRYSVWLNR